MARALLKDQSIPVAQIAKRLGVSRATFYAYFPATNGVAGSGSLSRGATLSIRQDTRLRLCGQSPPHVVGTAAGFHGHNASRQLRGEGDDRLAPHTPAQDHPASLVQANNAATGLAQIDPENRNSHAPSPFLEPDRQPTAISLG